MKHRKYLMILLVSIILMSCQDKKTTEPNDQNTQEIMPLALDNFWQYELNTIAYACNEGVLECQPFFISDSIVHEITDKLEIEYENETFEVFAFLNEFDALPPMALRNTDDGLVQYGEIEYGKAVSFDPEVKLLVKFPIAVEETWIDQEGYAGIEYKCISTNETMTTPAGTFSCYVFEVVDDDENDGEYVRYYYTPDIGLVAEIHHREVFYYNNVDYDIPPIYQDHYKKLLNDYSLNQDETCQIFEIWQLFGKNE